MNAEPSPSGSWLASRRVRAALVAIFLVAILLGTITLWYFFFRPAGPPPIGPGAPVIPAAALPSASAVP